MPRGRPRKDPLPPQVANVSLSESSLIDLSMIREMERTGNWFFPLPSGAKILLTDASELEVVRLLAKPYLESAGEISGDAWNDISQILTNYVVMERINRELTQISRDRMTKKFDTQENRDFWEREASERQSDLIRQLNTTQRIVNEQRLKLDQLRSMSKVQAGNLVDYVAGIEADAIAWAEEHIGEFQYMVNCPSVDCRFYTEPFICLQQSPHFAFDFAASPAIVWNQTVFELTQKYYTQRKDWTDLHRSYDGRGLSFTDAAKILMISPIGWMMAIYEKQNRGKVEFPLDLELVVNNPKRIARFIEIDPRKRQASGETPEVAIIDTDDDIDPYADPATVDSIEQGILARIERGEFSAPSPPEE